MRRTREGVASRNRNPECRLESGSVSSRGAGRRSRLQVQIPASEHESATVPTPGFCGSQIISYFCRCLPRGRLRPDGGIGRHAGLKILWPAMAVPVRSRLRVPTKSQMTSTVVWDSCFWYAAAVQEPGLVPPQTGDQRQSQSIRLGQMVQSPSEKCVGIVA